MCRACVSVCVGRFVAMHACHFLRPCFTAQASLGPAKLLHTTLRQLVSDHSQPVSHFLEGAQPRAGLACAVAHSLLCEFVIEKPH
jgi:hypothetical protein